MRSVEVSTIDELSIAGLELSLERADVISELEKDSLVTSDDVEVLTTVVTRVDSTESVTPSLELVCDTIESLVFVKSKSSK